MNTLQLDITGMHCTACANIITRSLKKVPGVKEAQVNYTAEKATINFNSDQATINQLIDAVSRAGYKASVIDASDTGRETKKRAAEIKSLYKKFIASAALSLPMLYFMLFDFFPGRF